MVHRDPAQSSRAPKAQVTSPQPVPPPRGQMLETPFRMGGSWKGPSPEPWEAGMDKMTNACPTTEPPPGAGSWAREAAPPPSLRVARSTSPGQSRWVSRCQLAPTPGLLSGSCPFPPRAAAHEISVSRAQQTLAPARGLHGGWTLQHFILKELAKNTHIPTICILPGACCFLCFITSARLSALPHHRKAGIWVPGPRLPLLLRSSETPHPQAPPAPAPPKAS